MGANDLHGAGPAWNIAGARLFPTGFAFGAPSVARQPEAGRAGCYRATVNEPETIAAQKATEAGTARFSSSQSARTSKRLILVVLVQGPLDEVAVTIEETLDQMSTAEVPDAQSGDSPSERPVKNWY
jgi:hypothetical protein